MDLGFIFLAVALIGVVLFVILQPFLEPQTQRTRPAPAADDLAAEREGILNTLRDLDFDHSTGKITDAEHAAQRAQLLAHGAAVLKQLDTVGLLAAEPESEEKAMEQAIAARRKTASATAQVPDRACPACHAESKAEDRFCASCGTELARACPQCSAAVSMADRFCGQCGAPMLVEVAQ